MEIKIIGNVSCIIDQIKSAMMGKASSMGKGVVGAIIFPMKIPYFFLKIKLFGT